MPLALISATQFCCFSGPGAEIQLRPRCYLSWGDLLHLTVNCSASLFSYVSQFPYSLAKVAFYLGMPNMHTYSDDFLTLFWYEPKDKPTLVQQKGKRDVIAVSQAWPVQNAHIPTFVGCFKTYPLEMPAISVCCAVNTFVDFSLSYQPRAWNCM